LIGTEIQIERHGGPRRFGLFGGKHRGATTWLTAQARACDQENPALGNRRGQNIINRQLNIGAVVTIVDQGKSIRWLDA
jgi:hypothetical protein